MLLLSSPRCGHQRRASLLLLAAVLLCVVPATASLPAGSKCPRHIDCAKEGRRFCKPGSSHCGPCLPSLEENEEGICVAKRRHRHAKISQMYPDLDEEIDYLHSYIEKQQVSEIKSSTKQPKRPVSPVVPKPKSQERLSTNATAATTAAQPAASAHANASTPRPGATAADGRAAPAVAPVNNNDNFIVLMVSVCVVVGAVAVIMATVCYVRLQKESRLAQKVDYPAFKGAGAPTATANGSSLGDKTLAQSAQMYHYQHQKQQMLSMGNHKPEQKAVDTEVTSDEEEVGGDFTVYECPGLAPTGEMEVKNPLFDDSTLHYQGNQK